MAVAECLERARSIRLFVCVASVLGAVACPCEVRAQPKPGESGASSLIVKGSELFDDQRYEESIQTLSAALVRPGTSLAERIEIYRLLAYNYITLKRAEEADAAVRGILALDEGFTLSQRESPRFRDFFDATRAKWEAEGKPGKGTEGAARPEAKPVRIHHRPPAQVEPSTIVRLSGTVDDPQGKVRRVELKYRAGASGRFATATGSYAMGRFRAEIPATAVKPPLVEYYLEVVDPAGLPLSSRGDATTPLRIAVPEPKGGGVFTSPWFWVPVGVAVVGGVVVTAILMSQSGGTSTVTVKVSE